MKTWQEDLLYLVSDEVRCERDVFARIERAAVSLEFEHVAYGFQAPLPLSKPKVTLLNNYPRAWQEHYAANDYLLIDPTVNRGRKSRAPIIWCDELFADAQSLWGEAKEHGLKFGWAQSSLDGHGVGGMLTLSRSAEPLTLAELEANQQKMRWLVQMSHMAFSRIFRNTSEVELHNLTDRELEVLKWTADGKSAQDIAEILSLSKNTVDFHIKNSIVKLQAANKTAAVVRAALLGFLN